MPLKPFACFRRCDLSVVCTDGLKPSGGAAALLPAVAEQAGSWWHGFASLFFTAAAASISGAGAGETMLSIFLLASALLSPGGFEARWS